MIGHRYAIVGRGRIGHALSAALAESVDVIGPLGRGADAADADVVLLAVPDKQIASAAAAIAPGRLVGHLSGGVTLAPLAPHEAFSVHPLVSVTRAAGPAPFTGATAAVAGATERARSLARGLAGLLGMNVIEIADEDRVAYHTAASIAANFVVTLGAATERLAANIGVSREAFGPLARSAVENWIALGAEGALTGPITRGDEATVERQRRAVRERAPELLPLFDVLVDATRELAARGVGGPVADLIGARGLPE
jgi:predicted short-subunit dehydrogenase-like oxidoreductase (DUF2520 family)